MRVIVVAFVMVVVAGVVLAACGANHSDSGTSDRNFGPARVLAFPDGFRNVAAKCDGPNMVYSGSRGQSSDHVSSGVAVVPNDQRCPGSTPPASTGSGK